MKNINDCYAVVQIDGKFKGWSDWNCVAYGYPTFEEIPEKYKNKKIYKIAKIGSFAKGGKKHERNFKIPH